MISYVKKTEPQPLPKEAEDNRFEQIRKAAIGKASEIRHRWNPPPRPAEGGRQPANLRRMRFMEGQQPMKYLDRIGDRCARTSTVACHACRLGERRDKMMADLEARELQQQREKMRKIAAPKTD